MNIDIVTLILAPLAVGFLLLYLQQLGKVKELRADAESKKEKVDELLGQLKKTTEQYEEALRAARNHYSQSEDQKNTQIEWSLNYIHSLRGFFKALIEINYENTPPHLRGISLLTEHDEKQKDKEA